MGWKYANRRRLLFITILLALVAAAGASVWASFFRQLNKLPTGGGRFIGVVLNILKYDVIGDVASRAEHDVPVQVFGFGTAEARVTSKVGSSVSGVLVDLRADVGDRLAKGAVLARLDDREQRARANAP